MNGQQVFVVSMERRDPEGGTAAFATVRIGPCTVRWIVLLRIGRSWGLGLPRRYMGTSGWTNVVELDDTTREQVLAALVAAYEGGAA